MAGVEGVDAEVLKKEARRGNRDPTQELMMIIDSIKVSGAPPKRSLSGPQVQGSPQQKQALCRIIQILLHAEE